MARGQESWKPASLSPSIVTLSALLAVADCGGGIPLLHPAQALPLGEVRAATGFSGNIVTGGLAGNVQAAANDASGGGVPGPPGTDATYARGALVVASGGPGLAPFVAGRAGIGDQFDDGIASTGRSVRIDIRRSFDLSGHWALSAGAGGSVALYGHQEGSELPDVDLGQMHGVGADVPILLGYQSDGDLYALWLGARAGWEHVDISEVTSEPGSEQVGAVPIGLSATRLWGGGLLGASVGFRHVHVAMELDVSYASITGEYNQTHAEVGGVILTPATALWWAF
jgi:hypothetical protein